MVTTWGHVSLHVSIHFISLSKHWDNTYFSLLPTFSNAHVTLARTMADCSTTRLLCTSKHSTHTQINKPEQTLHKPHSPRHSDPTQQNKPRALVCGVCLNQSLFPKHRSIVSICRFTGTLVKKSYISSSLWDWRRRLLWQKNLCKWRQGGPAGQEAHSWRIVGPLFPNMDHAERARF